MPPAWGFLRATTTSSHTAVAMTPTSHSFLPNTANQVGRRTYFLGCQRHEQRQIFSAVAGTSFGCIWNVMSPREMVGPIRPRPTSDRVAVLTTTATCRTLRITPRAFRWCQAAASGYLVHLRGHLCGWWKSGGNIFRWVVRRNPSIAQTSTSRVPADLQQ